MTIHVVTRVPPRGDGGNLATEIGSLWVDPQAWGGQPGEKLRSLGEVLGNPLFELFVRAPVFKLGEILVLDHHDRDQFGRKPSKWSVSTEQYDSIARAAQRAREVVANEAAALTGTMTPIEEDK